MNVLLLLQRQDEPDWVRWIVVGLFFGFPLLARLVRSLLVRFGLARAEPDEAAEARDPRELRRQAREERRKSESEGEELWRRLARGEVEAPPPVAAPVFQRAAQPRTQPEFEPGGGLEPANSEVSLELESEPQPLSVLGEVSEPSEAPEVSLEQALEPAALAALSAAPLSVRSSDEQLVARPRAAFVLARGDLRRAILLSEILGPPVSQRT